MMGLGFWGSIGALFQLMLFIDSILLGVWLFKKVMGK